MTPQDQQQGQIQQVGGADSVREQDKIMLVLAYMPCFLPLIPFLTVKDSDFVKWHSKQGLVLTGAAIVLWVPMFIVSMVVPILGQLIGCAFAAGSLVLVVLAITKAMKGERWRIPVLADLADKF